MKRLVFLALFAAAGCGAAPEPPTDAGKYIAPRDRATMPAHERDDPHTLMHLQPDAKPRGK